SYGPQARARSHTAPRVLPFTLSQSTRMAARRDSTQLLTIYPARLRGDERALSGESQPRLKAREQPACSTTTTVMADQSAIKSQSVRLTASQSCPERRSDDGQPILEPIRMAPKSRSDLGFLVDLWGFEPQTSCMPSGSS